MAEETDWFERLYVAASRGDAQIPWEREGPNPTLAEWTAASGLRGDGRHALVVGAGLGTDAEHLAAVGFRTTAFDVAPSGVAAARRRHPNSAVDYRVADLLDPPDDLLSAFDFVLESLTVQSLPPSYRALATANVARFVAPGGTLLVIATSREEDEEPDGPPWPLTRAEVEAFAGSSLQLRSLESLPSPNDPAIGRWRAVFIRPSCPAPASRG